MEYGVWSIEYGQMDGGGSHQRRRERLERGRIGGSGGGFEFEFRASVFRAKMPVPVQDTLGKLAAERDLLGGSRSGGVHA